MIRVCFAVNPCPSDGSAHDLNVRVLHHHCLLLSSFINVKSMLVQEFRTVFALPGLPQDGDVGVVSHWLSTHGGQPPSRRGLDAIRAVSESHGWGAILRNYTDHVRSEVVQLGPMSIQQLTRLREYFLAPMRYIHLTPLEYAMVERTVNSVVKDKITSIATLTREQEAFISSLGLDTVELTRLRYESEVRAKTQTFAGVWDRSFLDQIANDEFSMVQLSSLRISELFDMVLNFPASAPALQDLRTCLHPSQRNDLVNAFMEKCNSALLHAGINTNEIIICFISTIKSFLLVDPVGVLLDTALRPIKRYLHKRDDTIPVVINALINSDPSDELCQLAEELSREPEKTVDDLTLSWSPAPIDALPDFRKQDIIEALISLNDKRLFIEELELVIAQRLLTLKNFDITEMLAKLSQLKLRFADNELSKLDVMISDIVQSEEVDSVIHRNNTEISSDLQFSILSHAYWPDFEQERFNPPIELQQQISQYEESYKAIKTGRLMKWINSGVVELELEFGAKTLSLSVAPVHAAVIACFSGQESLTLAEVMTDVGMSLEITKKAISFWQEIGIIAEDGAGRYHVIENPESKDISNLTTATASRQVDHSLDYCWLFINGMLTNLGGMGVPQIHKFLCAVVPKNKGFTASLDELQLYLTRCVHDDKLIVSGDKYQLKN